MASKTFASTALLLSLNLLFVSLASSDNVPCPPPPHKHHHHPLPPPKPASCPLDTLELGVCADLLGGLINLGLGMPPKKPCCSLLMGLADLEAAVCLCTALKADILGINLNISIDLSLVLNVCGKEVPAGYYCA